jgi:hypothetical protein
MSRSGSAQVSAEELDRGLEMLREFGYAEEIGRLLGGGFSRYRASVS